MIEKCGVICLEEDDEIMILVGGQPVTTIIENGVQRFKQNSVIDHLFRRELLDVNGLWIDFYRGDFDRDGFIDFYMGLGYSVSGFVEVWGPGSSYHANTGDYVEVVNPVWLDEKELAQT